MSHLGLQSMHKLSPRQSKRISQLGLFELNIKKGWGANFHSGFKDLNPQLNPKYKFQRKKLSQIMAEKYI